MWIKIHFSRHPLIGVPKEPGNQADQDFIPSNKEASIAKHGKKFLIWILFHHGSELHKRAVISLPRLLGFYRAWNSTHLYKDYFIRHEIKSLSTNVYFMECHVYMKKTLTKLCGFQHFLFSPLPGEMIQFDYLTNIFEMGWNHQLASL